MMPVETSSDPRFSKVLPGLQLRVNSSSLGPFKACPRQYYYKIVCGLEGESRSVHLTFGTLVHKGSELYDLNKLRGMSHEDNLLNVLEWALRTTWDFARGAPWQSGHSAKNRLGLIRTLVWYLDHYGENDNLETVRLADGTPAIEIDFEIDSGYVSQSTNEAISFIGKLDKLVSFNDVFFVKDIKTTEYAVDGNFFTRFTPDNQFSLYTIAGKVAFGIDVRGLICDGVQVGASFARFARNVIPRTEASLDEWLRDAAYWLRQMEVCAVNFYWPQNDKSCGLFGGCEFRSICGLDPASRETWLGKSFRKKKEIVNEDVL